MHHTIRAVSVAGAIVLGLAIGHDVLAQTTSPPKHLRIDLKDLAMLPALQRVRVGDTVTWTNHDIVPHTVTAAKGAFDSKLIASKGAWTHVIKRADFGEYHCIFHPTMKATIIIDK